MNHECPANGCTRTVPRSQLACRTHWFKVSKPTRDWVYSAYRSKASDHWDAMAQAVTEMNAGATS